jgi:predicted AAA+ superfamily ATPase
VNRLALRGELLPGSELYGKAFENWVFHELSAFMSYCDFDGRLSYWRLASGIEVDFVLGDMQVAIEAKSSAKITRDHLKGLRSLVEDHPRVQRRMVVCREPRARKTEDGIEILPVASFIRRLWSGDLARLRE